MKLALLTLLLLSGDEFADGQRAWSEGRFADALAAFVRADQLAGESASAELLHNEALAALRTGDAALADTAAGRAAERGGAEFEGFRDFIRGNAAFMRCSMAEAATDLPGAPPNAFDLAIAHAEAAQRLWRAAALSRSDWPEARRNVERAIIKADQLRLRKEDAANNPSANRKKAPGQSEILNPKPLPRPNSKKSATPDEPDTPEAPKKPDQKGTDAGAPPDAGADARPKALSPADLGRLVDRLHVRDLEKLRVRRTEQAAPAGRPERDW